MRFYTTVLYSVGGGSGRDLKRAPGPGRDLPMPFASSQPPYPSRLMPVMTPATCCLLLAAARCRRRRRCCCISPESLALRVTIQNTPYYTVCCTVERLPLRREGAGFASPFSILYMGPRISVGTMSQHFLSLRACTGRSI